MFGLPTKKKITFDFVENSGKDHKKVSSNCLPKKKLPNCQPREKVIKMIKKSPTRITQIPFP